MPERSRIPVTTTDVHNASTYTNHKCGCVKCCAAHAAKQVAARERRRLALLANPTLAPHGDDSTYTNWRCKCEPCIKAHTKLSRERKLRRS